MEKFPYRAKIFPRKLVAPKTLIELGYLSPVTFERLQYKQRIAAYRIGVHYQQLGLVRNRIH